MAKTPRAIFAQHDPEGRIKHTIIRHITSMMAAHTRYDVYYLDFTNPESNHGMQHIAVIRNDRDFMGSAYCDAYVEDIRWGGNRLWLEHQDLRRNGFKHWREDPHGQAMHFYSHRMKVDKYFCGQADIWGDGI